MRDDRVTFGTAMLFWPHGGSQEPDETIAPSYEAEPEPLPDASHPGLAPWVSHARFAPPGPALATLPTVHLVLPLFGAAVGNTPATPELPEALLDEPAVFEHLAGLVAADGSGATMAADFDAPVDEAEMSDQDPIGDDDEAAPGDWSPPEPAEPSLETLPPPYWSTTTDPVRNAELTEGHGTQAEPPHRDPEPSPLHQVEEQVPKPAPTEEESPPLLSWLDRRLRARQQTPSDLPAEPLPVPTQTAAPTPVEISVVEEAPHPGLPELPEPPPLPVEPPAPTDAPVVLEPAPENPIEPRLPAPEPTPVGKTVVVEPTHENQTEWQPLAPAPPQVERSVVLDTLASPRVEPRPPARPHLPSLFAPSAEVRAKPSGDQSLRARRFAWLPRWSVGRPKTVPTARVAGDANDSRPFRQARPDPIIAVPALPTVVEVARPVAPDLPDHAVPEPPPPEAAVALVPEPPPPAAPDLPPETAEIVANDVTVAPTPEPAAPHEAKEEPALPTRTAAYWAEPTWAKSAQTLDQPESLAWTPPASPLAGPPGARRTTPAMEGLWETESTGASDSGAASQGGTGQRLVRRAAILGAAVLVLIAASAAVLHFLPRAFVSNVVPAATFNAPMMVLRANGPGRVVSIAVQNGQTVEPDTLLLTIRTEPQPDPAASLLRARLEAAMARLSELDQSLAQATPATDAGRVRIADLRRQRAAAVIDVAQLQDGVTNIPTAKSSDLPVKAGIHGVIRSLEARTGTTTAAGVPLVRMLDCDHAFLTVGPDSKLRAGEAVQVRLPNLPPVGATVRQSAGIAEPPDSLVIATQPGAFVGQLSGSCPIGATATVTPSITGS